MNKKRVWTTTISHYLLGCRLDNYFHLLNENHWRVPINRVPQALVIFLFSLFMFPFALIEELYSIIFVYPKKIKEDPVFILGHWRSGTTYLQNLMSQDPQFAFFDPVTTYTNGNAIMLHKPIYKVQEKAVTKARPMDNVDYESDSPSEECFAVAGRSVYDVVHVMAFPENSDLYIDRVVMADKPLKQRNAWCRAYHKCMSKVSYIHKGKRLLVKSPDNTAHVQEILRMYPNAKFIHIYRTPYRVVPSTINMFKKTSAFLSLQDIPSDEVIENQVVRIYGKMYHQYLDDRKLIPEGNLIEIQYEDFIKEPADYLKKIYETLGIEGYENAKDHFQDHIESQKDYQVAQHKPNPVVEEKIRKNLKFAFDEFGYEL